MNPVVDDVVAFCRMFAVFERDQICCGTVTVAQCVVLQTLLSDTWDVSSLAAKTRVTKGAMTRLVNGLEERGFVERQQDPEDGRRWFIALTPNGQREAKRLRKMTEDAVTLILARIPESKRESTQNAIGLLRSAVEQVRDKIECC